MSQMAGLMKRPPAFPNRRCCFCPRLLGSGPLSISRPTHFATACLRRRGRTNEAAIDAADGCNFTQESNRLPVKKNQQFPDFFCLVCRLDAEDWVTDAGKATGRGSDKWVGFGDAANNK